MFVKVAFCLMGLHAQTKHTVPPWKAVNLRTGKPLLDENFKNMHWPIPIDRNNSLLDRNDSVTNRNASFCDNIDNFVACLDELSDWDPVLDILKDFSKYSDLENYVDSLPKNILQHLKTSVFKYNRSHHTVNEIAKISLPFDAPQNCVPIWTVGDGDCLTCTLSIACFGDDCRNVELRARIVVEGVCNRYKYLDNAYLTLGSNSLRQQGTFTEQFALFSGQYAHGDLQDVIESVYDNEMLAMCKPREYMGMWQIWAASNVLGRPVCRVFPMHGSPAFHSDFNRLCVPFNAQLRKREPVVIMWTPTVLNGRIHHFVPLLKK